MFQSELENVLQGALSPENATRRLAEEELERLSSLPGFYEELACFASFARKTAPLSIRLIALSALKQKASMIELDTTFASVVGLLLGALEESVQGSAGDAVANNGTSQALVKQVAAVVAKMLSRLELQQQQLSESEHVSERTPDEGGESTEIAAASALFNQCLGEVGARTQRAVSQASPLAVQQSYLILAEELQETCSHGKHAVNSTVMEGMLSLVSPLLSIAVAAPVAAASGGDGCGDALSQVRLAALQLEVQCAAVRVVQEQFMWAIVHTDRKGDIMRELRRLFDSYYSDLKQRMFVPCSQLLRGQKLVPAGEGGAIGGHRNISLLQLELSFRIVDFVADVLAAARWLKAHADEATLTALLDSLQRDAELYHATLATDDSTHNGGGGDEEGDEEEEGAGLLSQHIAKRWTFFTSLAMLPSSRSVFVAAVGSGGGLAFLRLMAAYAYVSGAEAISWTTDVNEYLRREEERKDELCWTVRDLATSAFEQSVCSLGPIFIHAALEYLHELLYTDGSSPGEAPQPWREREVALFFFEQVLVKCRRELRACGVPDFGPLAQLLLERDAGGPPVLAARAVSLLAAIVRFMHDTRSLCLSQRHQNGNTSAGRRNILPEEEEEVPAAPPVGLVVHITIESLGGSATSAPTPLVQVAACQLLLSCLSLCDASVFRNAFAQCQKSLLGLLAESRCDEETGISQDFLYLVLECLTAWMKRHEREERKRQHQQQGVALDGLAPLDPAAVTVLFDCWRRHIADPNMGECLLPLFKLLCASPSDAYSGSPSATDAALVAQLPWITRVLSGNCGPAEYCAVPQFIQLLACLFRCGSAWVAAEAARTVLSDLCTLLLYTDESSVLDASSRCLAALLRRCPEGACVEVALAPSLIGPWLLSAPPAMNVLRGNAAMERGLQEERCCYPLSYAMLAVMLRMLSPELGETILLNAGSALVAAVECAGQFQEVQVCLLIERIVDRLATVRTDVAAQQLIAPLAALLKLYPQAFLHALLEAGLVEVAFQQWLPRLPKLEGYHDMLASCNALLGLLVAWPSDGSFAGFTCQWFQPSLGSDADEDVLGATGGAQHGRRKKKKIKSTSAKARGVKTITLTLDAAVFIAVGKALVSILRRLEEGNLLDLEDDLASDLDNGSGGRLFQEDDDDDEEFESAEDDDDIDGDEWVDDAAVIAAATVSSGGDSSRLTEQTKLVQAQDEVRQTFTPMMPLASQYTEVASQLFSRSEYEVLALFFQALQS